MNPFKAIDVLISGDYFTRCAICWKADHIGYPRADGAVCIWHINARPAEISAALREAGF